MHFADTHFGVETYGRLDPATGLNTRLQDFKRSLGRVIDLALERGVQLAVFSGDAYKSRDPSQTHQREFADIIRRLTESGVPVVMLTGNHDIPNVRGRANAMEIYHTLGVSGVRVLQQPTVEVIQTTGGPVQIVAMPYCMKGFLLTRDEYMGRTGEQVRQLMEAKYALELADLVARADPALPTVLMGHFWVRGARLSTWQQGYFHVHEPQIPVEELAREPFDYVALGHIHRHQDLNPGGYPSVVYSGSPDRIDFGERDEPKGFVMVSLAKGATTWEYVETPGVRPFLEIEVAPDESDDAPTETILAEIRRHALRGAIVRLTCRLTPEQSARVPDRELREALAPAFLVVAIRREVQRDARIRDALLSESLDPAAALARYLDTTERGRQRKVALLPYAELLFEELRREEALS